MSRNETPAVPIFRDSEGRGKVLCPYCCRLHGHGIGGDLRTSDCDLTETGSYTVFTVNGALPDEAKTIDKRVRRIQMILRDRKDRGGWFDSKWKKPTTAFLAEWEALKSQASGMNRRILKENDMTIKNGVLICPTMACDEAASLLGSFTSDEIHAMPKNDVITLLVKSKGGECWQTENGDIDFTMPPPSPEEEAAQRERSRIAIEEYFRREGA